MTEATAVAGMRVVVVVGPEAGHAIPAVELCRRLAARGAVPVLLSGERWRAAAARERIGFAVLRGLAPLAGDDDADAGAKLHARAARMALAIVDDVAAQAPDLVVADTITVAGGMAAELLGIPWVELVPHPLHLPSRGLPPIGSGLAPGEGVRGRLRDAALRAVTRPQIRRGRAERGAARRGIGLPARDPGPVAVLVATVPCLESPRPDWPDNAFVVGPLVWDPTVEELALPAGSDSLVLVAPSTAANADVPLAETALRALAPERMGADRVRVAVTTFGAVPEELPPWASAGRSRQEGALREASVVVCGGGHGMVAKAVLAGAPAVVVPGGGDQWDLARRAERAGIAVVVRPLTEEALAAAVRDVFARRRQFSAAVSRARSGAVGAVDPVAVCARAAGGGLRWSRAVD